MTLLATIAGIALGAIIFAAGYWIGRLGEKRRKTNRRRIAHPFSVLHGDEAARLAIEGDTFDPDHPARWPQGHWLA